MIGEIFDVEEIDKYGQPWIRKSWLNEEEGKRHSHSFAVESQEMELVTGNVLSDDGNGIRIGHDVS